MIDRLADFFVVAGLLLVALFALRVALAGIQAIRRRSLRPPAERRRDEDDRAG